MEGLIWVQRALGVGIRGTRCVRMGLDGYEGPWVDEGVLELI